MVPANCVIGSVLTMDESLIGLSLVLGPMCGVLMHACEMLPRVRMRKVGGLRFLRVGRLQCSFCLVRMG